MLDDLDHALARGYGYLSYVRYLDDMVVLTYDSKTGRDGWPERANASAKESRSHAARTSASSCTRSARVFSD